MTVKSKKKIKNAAKGKKKLPKAKTLSASKKKKKTTKKKPIVPKPEIETTIENDNVAVTMVVDESGSMAGLVDATVAGFNEYVESTKKDLKGRTHFSALCFNTNGIRTLQHGVAIKDAILLGPHNYCPSGGTPLLDAVGQAILATDSVMVTEGAKKVIVVIQTDGQENQSVKYKLADIKTMIEDRQSRGWQFVFIGAGINAFADATAMGIMAMNTMSYSADAVGTRNTFHATAANTRAFAAGAASTMNYSVDQSTASNEPGHIISAKLKAAKEQQKPETK